VSPDFVQLPKSPIEKISLITGPWIWVLFESTGCAVTNTPEFVAMLLSEIVTVRVTGLVRSRSVLYFEVYAGEAVMVIEPPITGSVTVKIPLLKRNV